MITEVNTTCMSYAGQMVMYTVKIFIEIIKVFFKMSLIKVIVRSKLSKKIHSQIITKYEEIIN